MRWKLCEEGERRFLGVGSKTGRLTRPSSYLYGFGYPNPNSTSSSARPPRRIGEVVAFDGTQDSYIMMLCDERPAFHLTNDWARSSKMTFGIYGVLKNLWVYQQTYLRPRRPEKPPLTCGRPQIKTEEIQESGNESARHTDHHSCSLSHAPPYSAT